MKGSFSDESLRKFSDLVAQTQSANFSEGGEVYDFTRCVRPDGSSYGTGGQCRKGTEGEAKKKSLVREAASEVKAILSHVPAHVRDLASKEGLKEAKAILAHVPTHVRDLIKESPAALAWLLGKDDNDYSESDTFDFTRCVRPDGSAYGTRGACRKGKEGAAQEKQAIDELGSMLPRGEKIVDSKGGLHTAGGAAPKPSAGGKGSRGPIDHEARVAKHQAAYEAAKTAHAASKAALAAHKGRDARSRALKQPLQSKHEANTEKLGAARDRLIDAKMRANAAKAKAEPEAKKPVPLKQLRANLEARKAAEAAKAAAPSEKPNVTPQAKLMEQIGKETNVVKRSDLMKQLNDLNNPLVKLPDGRVARTRTPASPYEIISPKKP